MDPGEGPGGPAPPLFLDQNEKKKMKCLPTPQGLDPPLFHTFKMNESGRKIEPKEIPKLFDSSLLPYWYLFSQVFNFALLVILKKVTISLKVANENPCKI